jgi:hypothetical protein
MEVFKLFKISDRVAYHVSNMGTIKTINIKSGKERILTLSTRRTCKTDKQGYLVFGINTGGKHKNYYVHRAVSEIFLESPAALNSSVNHIDGNKHNNLIGNLEWSNHKENALHAYRLNLINKPDLRGKKNPNYGKTRYSLEQIMKAFTLMDSGTKGGDITKITGIDTKNLSRYRINRGIYEKKD